MLKIEEFYKSHLLTLAWRFGQSYTGGYLAGQMIMATLANRQRCGWGSWGDVIEKVPMYMAENELPPLKFPSGWDGSFVKLQHVVDGVFDGSIPDMSKGALYWGDLNRIERPWFKEKVVDPIKEDGPTAGQRQHPIVANMNSLSFFR
jgi:hypothetical protein